MEQQKIYDLYRRKIGAPSGFHLMAKPSGSSCNLRCRYCFYTEKDALYERGHIFRMSDAVLEAYVRKYIEGHPPGAPVAFAWQGGEPTLMGLDFFRRAVDLQKRYADGHAITNSFQTNGMLIDDDWCAFFREQGFLAGLSLDGPADIHDAHRVDIGGHPTHDRVMHALELLKKHRVSFNTLTCISRRSSRDPVNVYRFLRDHGSKFMQFIPIVEQTPNAAARALGLDYAVPPSDPMDPAGVHPEVMPWSVTAEGYGHFMIHMFDEWRAHDVSRVFVMNFEWAMASYLGRRTVTCCFDPVSCGRCAVIEHDGSLYACDHYVYPEFRLGNILEDGPLHLLDTPRQRTFSDAKITLPRVCRECEWLSWCWGACPKHRFIRSPDGEAGWNWLCAGYRRYFAHIRPHLKVLARQKGLA